MMNRIQILDLLSGKEAMKYYQLYDKTQWYSEDEMSAFQLAKLKALIRHIYKNVPYYTKFINNSHINIDNIDSIEVLKEFPIITKEIIKANYEDFTPLNISTIKNVKTGQTSGTTGNILIKRHDMQTRSSVWGTYLRFYDWMGINNYNEPSIYLSGGHILKQSLKQKVKSNLIELVQNSKGFSPYTLTEEYIKSIYKYLIKKKPTLIRGYSQAIYELAKGLDDLGLSFNVKAITTTAEPLLPHHRDLFRKVFYSEAFDQYGCGEIGGSAYECDHHKGLHIAQERVIVEQDAEKNLIVTDLDNFSLPYIRYVNDDQGILSEEKCSCGRQSPIIEKILGRTCDIIVGRNNSKLHWAYFYHLMFETGIAVKRNMVKFQMEQKSENEIILRFVGDTFSTDDKNTLKTELKNILGDLDFEVINVDNIAPTKTGKFRPIISNLV